METIRNVVLGLVIVFSTSCSKQDSSLDNQISNDIESEVDQKENNFPSISSQTFEANEGISDDLVIGIVKAEDADNDVLFFSITSNSNGLFEVTEEGELSLAAGKHLDYEVSTEHSIFISVSDGQDSKSASIKIVVLNEIDSMVEEADSFITKWAIPHDDFELTIGTWELYEYDFMIDWGDGSPVENITSQNPSHMYDKAGEYLIAIQGHFPAINMGQSSDSGSYRSLVGLEQWGSNVWYSFAYAFNKCQFMKYNATDVPDLTNVESMAAIFSYAFAFNGNLNDWDVSNVKNMGSAFSAARSFNGDLSGWEVNNVTNMRYMFSGAKNFNGNIQDWDIDKVKDMLGMFRGASSFNQNLSLWNIQSIETMSEMFDNSGMSPENFSQTMIGWANNSNVPSNIPFGIEGMSICGDNQEAIDAMVFKLNLELEWEFSSPPNIIDCSLN